MQHSKEKISAAIARARGDLDQALAELERIPAFDPGTVAYHAHTLVNYLSVMRATVELMNLSLQDLDDPQTHRWLDGLEHSVQLMSHEVNQLSRQSSEREPQPRIEEVNLDALLQRAAAFYQRSAEKKQIQIYYTHPDSPISALTDRVIVSAVLDNLLSNAVKYTPHGKQIFVEAERSGDDLVCRVRDEGPGLSSEDQQKLFQRGVKLSPVPTGGETSSGYGLAVAKELIEKVGGSIWCESIRGKGSTFCFTVPEHRKRP